MPNQETGLQRINDKPTRNILRGFFSAGSNLERRQVLNHFREACPANELYTATTVLFTDPLFVNAQLPDGFPMSLDEILRRRRPNTISAEKEIRYQVARINQSSERLSHVVEAISEINSLISERMLRDALDAIRNLIEQHGLSLTVLRKLAFVQSRSGGDEELSESIIELINSLDLKIFSKQYFQVYEVLDSEEYFSGVLTHWTDEINALDDHWWPRLFLNNLWPFSFNSREFADLSLTHSFVSLTDSLFFIYSHYVSGLLQELGLSDYFAQAVSSALLSKMDRNFDGVQEIEQIFAEGGWNDTKAYRDSIAFLEAREIGTWRRALDSCFRSRHLGGWTSSSTIEGELGGGFFPNELKLKNLCAPPSGKQRLTRRYENHNSGIFERTAALIYCLERGASLTELSQNQVRVLLGHTTWLAFFLSRDELEQLHTHASDSNQLVVSFLTLCMLYERDPSADLEFAMRMEFQTAILKWFNGNLVEFLDWLLPRTPALSEYVGSICDVGFLERLYFLIGGYDEVLDLRADIFDWLSIHLKYPAAARQAERLRVDKKLRRIRKHIDDTRIYVDEVRFRLWAEERLQYDLRRIAESGISKLEPQNLDEKQSSESANLIRGEIVPGTAFWFTAICQNAYQQFCLNNVYGVSSYLSRRIRHGTLDGFLIGSVDQFLANYGEVLGVDQEWFSEAEKAWYVEYQQRVRTYRDDLLFFRNEDHPKGWFSASILSSAEKLQAFNQFQRRMLPLINAGLSPAELSIQLLAFCWQCLQTELINLQRRITLVEIAEIKARTVEIFKRKKGSPDLNLFCQQLDLVVTSRWTAFAAWFEKPESVSLSVTPREIAETVIAEVRTSYQGYRPKTVYEGDIDTRILGDMYHVLYDCLFILVTNAATKGPLEGELRILLDMTEDVDCRVLWIHVKSPLPENGAADFHIGRIRDALSNGDEDAAMTSEGFTGLRKLRRLVLEEWRLKQPETTDPDRFVLFTSDERAVQLAFGLPVLLF